MLPKVSKSVRIYAKEYDLFIIR